MAKKLLIVDDSALVRKQLREIIDDGSYDISMAKNGKEAVELASETQFDVITMDINMPVLDGMSAVEQIMKNQPTPILMVSSLTSENADVTMQALELGAVDYILKPGTLNVGVDENRQEIIQKVRSLSRIPKRRLTKRTRQPKITTELEKKEPKYDIDLQKLILIGSSTGGPGLIEQICAALPQSFVHTICIVQHMPEQFTNSFAKRLDRVCKLPVYETKNNLEMFPGAVYLARGGVHLNYMLKASGKVVFREDSQKHGRFFQPSVDEMILSAFNTFGATELVGVILTGIGDDGADAMVTIRKNGAYTMAESENSATVYGMPKEAFERGGVQEQLDFSQIVRKIATMH